MFECVPCITIIVILFSCCLQTLCKTEIWDIKFESKKGTFHGQDKFHAELN